MRINKTKKNYRKNLRMFKTRTASGFILNIEGRFFLKVEKHKKNGIITSNHDEYNYCKKISGKSMVSFSTMDQDLIDEIERLYYSENLINSTNDLKKETREENLIRVSSEALKLCSDLYHISEDMKLEEKNELFAKMIRDVSIDKCFSSDYLKKKIKWMESIIKVMSIDMPIIISGANYESNIFIQLFLPDHRNDRDIEIKITLPSFINEEIMLNIEENEKNYFGTLLIKDLINDGIIERRKIVNSINYRDNDVIILFLKKKIERMKKRINYLTEIV